MKTKLLITVILLSVSSVAFSREQANTQYSDLFEAEDSLMKKGLPREAVVICDKIYEKALSENNNEMLIKAITKRNKCYEMYEEDAVKNTIERLKKDALKAPEPAKQIIHSIIANYYWKYYKDNRWLMSGRTPLDDKEYNDNIDTWSTQKLASETVKQFDNSLTNKELLKNTPISEFNSLLEDSGANRDLRPTLYDVLIHKILETYSNEEFSITRPLDLFVVDNERFFAPASAFANMAIETSDTLSFCYKSISLYQELTRFRLSCDDEAALVDLEMERIKYINRVSTVNEKFDLTVDFYGKLKDSCKLDETKAEVCYRLAKLYYENAEPNINDFYEKSILQCQYVVDNMPQTQAATYCQNLIDKIKETSLSIEVESYNRPDHPFLAKITYRNISEVTIDIYQTEDSISKEDKPFRSWRQPLPAYSNFGTHSAEIAIDGLPLGAYFIAIYDSTDSSVSKNLESVSFQITSLLLTNRTDRKGCLFRVCNSQSGIPIEGVELSMYKHKYDSKKRRWDYELHKEIVTDNLGEAVFEIKNNSDFKVSAKYGNDKIVCSSDYFCRLNSTTANRRCSLAMYTDRAIYRPGQTAYFKGIILDYNGTLSNKKATVTLRDVNSKEVAVLDVRTNEYGSFSGSFAIPTSGLNGQYSLTLSFDDGYNNRVINKQTTRTTILVEEYRRPTFEIEFDKPNISYAFDDSVNITGTARTYSGTAIDNATVTYNVTRKCRPFRWWWNEPSSNETIIIANGQTTTDNDGKFVIPFVASSNGISNYDLIHEYETSVTITDITGESHVNSFTLRLSDKNLDINCDIPEKISEKTFNGANIIATNLNGEEVPTTATLKVTKLKNPGILYTQHPWTIDTIAIEETRFRQLFPNMAYRGEDIPENWEKEKVVVSKNLQLPSDKNVSFKEMIKEGSGFYIIEIKAVSENKKDTSEYKQMVHLTSAEPHRALVAKDWALPVETTCEPGETAEIWITSINRQAPTLYELVLNNDILERRVLESTDKPYQLLVPITEDYVGNVTVNLVQIANKQVYFRRIDVTVPYTNKKLDITFNTFRDKLQPGDNEKWSLTISDKSGKGVEAEMLATLYDASLDYFRKNNWNSSFYNNNHNFGFSWDDNLMSVQKEIVTKQDFVEMNEWLKKHETIDLGITDNKYNLMVTGYGVSPKSRRLAKMNISDVVMVEEESVVATSINDKAEIASDIDNTEESLSNEGASDKEVDIEDFANVETRTNFNETAFFYPHLYSNKDGNLDITFTIPEAITRWRMMGIANDKELRFGYIENELVTRKLVSISAYAPRFLREGDTLEISAKINNLTDNALEGNCLIEFTDAVTLKSVTQQFVKDELIKQFSSEANGSTSVSWKITVPEGLQAVTYKVSAKAGSHSDGEQKMLPILTNRQIVTESMPFVVRGGETKKLSFDKMIDNTSPTLRNHSYTVEYTSNPVWYAVQAIPYLMEYPYECSEQTFSRLYANAIASTMVNSSPRIKNVIDVWKKLTPDAFMSNLEKNQELKDVILEETPWLIDAQNENETKKRIGELFNINKMSNEIESAFNKLEKKQLSNGGFAWFDGMADNEYITLHITKGINEMFNIKAVPAEIESDMINMRDKALSYLDDIMEDKYKQILKDKEAQKTNKGKKSYMDDYQPSTTILNLLYTQSFLPNRELTKSQKEAFDYFYKQASKYWLSYNEMGQAMLSLTFNRFGDRDKALEIIKSLDNRAISSESDGMYWSNNRRGYFWYQAPIETQAQLITAFNEVANDMASVEEMKLWLIRNKQTTHWKTTTATTSACYALICQGLDLLSDSDPLEVEIAGQPLDKLKSIRPEAGTGYVKTAFTQYEITPEMGNLKVTNPNRTATYGAAYWQYFEQLDKITEAKTTDVVINKQLYIKTNAEQGALLKQITDKQPIKIGDEVVVRVEITAARDMEFVHLKDMRASGFEPTSTISGYRWQGGLGYYQEVKDAAVNFFIDYVRKGTYVFEYSLRASHAGEFSNGITTIQCMYAPEFTTHSAGERITIE